MMHLRITTEDRVTVCDLLEGQWMIGRSQQADIRIDNPSVSKIHCHVERDAEHVWIENRSQHGTLLDGQAVTERMRWPSGAVLKLGSSLLTWMMDEGHGGGTSGISSMSTGAMAEGSPSTTGRAGEKDTLPPTGSIPMAVSRMGGEHLSTQTGDPRSGSVAVTSQAPFSVTGVTAISSQAGVDHDDKATDAIHTLPVTAEDLKRIQEETKRKRVYRQTVVGAAVLLAGLFVVATLWNRLKEPPEQTIEWPVDNAGESIDHGYDAPLGGFRVICPGRRSERKELADGQFEATCLLGRKGDVPLVFRIEDMSNSDWVSLSLAVLAKHWMKNRGGPEADWVFEEPRGTALYFGEDNGTPFILINFTRTEIHGRKWIGCARVFRSGARLSVVSTCTPAEFLGRMENMLNLGYVVLSDEYVAACWEPLESVGPDDLGRKLAEVRAWADRDVPLAWRRTEDSLRVILTLAARQQDMVATEHALGLLGEFRGKKRKWYNQQALSFERSVEMRKDGEARRVKDLCMAVFDDPLDRRYDAIRKWRIQP